MTKTYPSLRAFDGLINAFKENSDSYLQVGTVLVNRQLKINRCFRLKIKHSMYVYVL